MYYSASLMDEIGNCGLKYKNLRFSVRNFIIHDHFERFFNRDLLDFYRLVGIEVQLTELFLHTAYPESDDFVRIAGRRVHIAAEHPVLSQTPGLLAKLSFDRVKRILPGLEFACGKF